MSTRQLIDAIASGDAVEIQTAFDASISARIVDRLDAMRQDVAQNMFKEAAESVDESSESYDSVAKKAFAASRKMEDHLDSMDDDNPAHEKKAAELSKQAVEHHKKAMNHPDRPAKVDGQDTKQIHKTHIQNYTWLKTEEVEDLEEADAKVHPDALHVQHVGGGKYKVHAVGKNFADGIKAGEHVSDSELDDFREMGGKVKNVK